MSRPLRAILWDNDGILVDTENLYFDCTRSVLAEEGVVLDREVFREAFLKDDRGVASFFPDQEERVRLLRLKRDARYTEILTGKNPLISGVPEVLETLGSLYRMCIVTSCPKHHFDLIHQHTEILPFFEFVLNPGDYARAKPHPDPYLEAVSRRGLPPDECLVIEDSERGLRAAVAAGIPCVVIPSTLTENGDFRGAEAALEKISDLPDYLRARQARG